MRLRHIADWLQGRSGELRLALRTTPALVPRPRLHLIRFHGVLAPNAKLRSKIVPAPASVPPRPQARTLTRRARQRA